MAPAQFRDLAPMAEPEPEIVPPGRCLIAAIGIDQYSSWPRLNHAVSDALGMQQLFIEKLGFLSPIEPLVDGAATERAITGLVQDRLPALLEPDDRLVLFFAGHGHTVDSQIADRTVETGYLIPVEAQIDRRSDFIKLDSFLDDVSQLPARHVLVILDACRSGFALGSAMRSYRSLFRYEQELLRRVSRKIITSAQRDQPAADSGPVANHGLFTGMLVDGLNWGTADLDGNGLISGSELGLFAQQRVAQLSESRQTPAFGAFHLDDGGELVISLGSKSFDAVKARAFQALQWGELERFASLVAQLFQLRPASPETLYLHYRLQLLQGHIDDAIGAIRSLVGRNLPAGTIPLSAYDLTSLDKRLPFWRRVLALAEGDFPAQVTLMAGVDGDRLRAVPVQPMGDVAGHLLRQNDQIRFQIGNPTDTPIHLYLITVDSAGRVEIPPLWADDEIAFNGLQPGDQQLSYPFVLIDQPGLCEARLVATPRRFPYLFRSPAPATRAAMPDAIDAADIAGMRVQIVRYRIEGAEAQR